MIQDKKLLRKTDIYFGIFLFAASVVVFIEVLKMPVELSVAGGGTSAAYTAPGLMPGVVSLILMMLSIFLITGALKEGAQIKKKDFARTIAWFKNEDSKRIVVSFIIIIIYIYGLLGRVSYYAATFLYLFSFMYYCKAGKWYKVLFISALTTAIIGFAFNKLVLIPLP